MSADASAGFPAGWLFTFTTSDPSSLPKGAASKAARAKSYALAVAFSKSPSYPFGTWWVVLALRSQ